MSAWVVPSHVDRRSVVDFDLFSDRRFAAAGTPQGALKLLADEVGCGIHWSPHNGGYWFINDHKLVRDAAADPGLFSSTAMTLPVMPPELEPRLIPLNLDPPQHGRYRSPLVILFGPLRIKALETAMRRYAIDLIESIAKDARCDFVASVAEPFPVITFMRLMGMDTSRLTEFRGWMADMMAPEVDARARSHANVITMMRELIERRQAKREDDLLSELLDMDIDGRPPTLDELESYCLLLFAAGLDTVANLLAFSMSHLASNPELQDLLRSDPSLIPNAAEEFLRNFSPTSPPRTVTRDAEFGGVRLKKGERVVLFLPAANYDPDAFTDPYKFDLNRASHSHVTFNTGPHLCAGRHLARLEIKVLLEEWLARMPNVRHDPAVPPEYRLGLTLACIKLPLVWDERS